MLFRFLWAHTKLRYRTPLLLIVVDSGQENIQAVMSRRQFSMWQRPCAVNLDNLDNLGAVIRLSSGLLENSYRRGQGGTRMMAPVKRLLQQTCTRVSKRQRKRLTPREYKHLQRHYRALLTPGLRRRVSENKNRARGGVRSRYPIMPFAVISEIPTRINRSMPWDQ